MAHEEPISTEIPDHEEAHEASAAVARALSEWGPGWPNCSSGLQATARGGGIRVTCRREIAELVGLLLEETVRRGYHIRQADTGAYNCRPIGGTRTASNHSWGLALDMNWSTNGFGYNVSHDIPQWVIDLWKTYGFSYGGDWSGKKDWMHFEWKRSKADAIRFTAKFKADHSGAGPTIPATKPDEPAKYGLLNSPVVGAVTHGGNALSRPDGYWLAAADGGVFAFGEAPFLGSLAGAPLAQPIVGLAAHPDGKGYWLVAEDGGIFAFGSAGFYGSLPPVKLVAPISGIAATETGKGYWLTAKDGGVFAFGDARFLGAVNQVKLNAPVVAIDSTRSGNGYWLTAEDGGIFCIGDAGYFGNAVGVANRKIVSMVATPTEKGYWLVSEAGQFYAYGDATAWENPPKMEYPVTHLLIADSEGAAIIAQDGAVYGAGPKPLFFGSVYDAVRK